MHAAEGHAGVVPLEHHARAGFVQPEAETVPLSLGRDVAAGLPRRCRAPIGRGWRRPAAPPTVDERRRRSCTRPRPHCPGPGGGARCSGPPVRRGSPAPFAPGARRTVDRTVSAMFAGPHTRRCTRSTKAEPVARSARRARMHVARVCCRRNARRAGRPEDGRRACSGSRWDRRAYAPAPSSRSHRSGGRRSRRGSHRYPTGGPGGARPSPGHPPAADHHRGVLGPGSSTEACPQRPTRGRQER